MTLIVNKLLGISKDAVDGFRQISINKDPLDKQATKRPFH